MLTPFWPGLFAKVLANVNIGSLVCNVGAGASAPSATAAPAEEKKVKAKTQILRSLMMTWALNYLTKPLL